MEYKDYLHAKANQMGIPLSVTFELSPVCNLSCKMCYVRKSPEEVRRHNRPMVAIEEWISLASELKNRGTLHLLLTGGEPFLWPDFWRLYEELYKMGFMLAINTNGSMIDEKVIDRLRKMPPSRINITLYGASDDTYHRLCGVHGIYDRVVHAIEGLQNAGIFVKLNLSVTPENVEDIPDFMNFIKSHNLQYDAVTYMFPPIRRDDTQIGKNERFTPKEAAETQLLISKYRLNTDEYGDYLRFLLNEIVYPLGLRHDCNYGADGTMKCIAGRTSFWTTWDGYMALCGILPDYKVDLRENGFESSWQKLRELAQSIRLSGSCNRCPNSKICYSCLAKAVAETGDPSGLPVYLCEMTEHLRKCALEESQHISSEKDGKN